MLTLKKLAITGGLASGKSLVCRYFSELGAYSVDADEIVHRLLTPDTELGKKTIELLGAEIVVEGKISRSRIASKVFTNPTLLRSLEEVIHPIVYEEIERQYQKWMAKKTDATLFIVEIPLLFESGGEKYFDYTVAVVADREICWERYRQTTGHEREDFNRRMARQLRQYEKAEKANYVIRNDGSPEELRQETHKLYQLLCGVKTNKTK